MSRITACICTFNRVDLLRKAIVSLLAQDSDLAVMVVDNASTDATRSLVEEHAATHPNLTYVYEAKAGLSNARNTALRECQTELIAFIDDDAIAEPDWARNMVAAFDELGPQTAAVGGRIIPIWEAPRPDWFTSEHEDYVSVLDHGEDTKIFEHGSVVGANMAFRIEALREAGGFSSRLGRKGHRLLGNEEYAIARQMRRMGLQIGYAGRATVHHLVAASRLDKQWILQRMKGQGISDAILLVHIEHDLKAFFHRVMYSLKPLLRSALSPSFERSQHLNYLAGAAIGVLNRT